MKKRFVCALLATLLALSLSVPALADSEGSYVVDLAGLLGYDQRERLEQRASEISQQYGCGVYIVALDDYTQYGTGDVFDVTTQIYHNTDYGFGMGDQRDGIMLLLSMAERDYALFVYGEKASDAFNSYGQEQLEGVFLDDFGENDWEGGFSDYIETCGEYLEKAASGSPVRESPAFFIVISILVSLGIAYLVCAMQKQKMVSVHQNLEASGYAVGNVQLQEQYDRFTHMTRIRRPKANSSGGSGGSGSVSRMGGGGSGRSGKF